ncbi:hypothetical protein GCM10023238_05320 [Streptomyces heliomycini]
MTKVRAHLSELSAIAGRNGGNRRSTTQGYTRLRRLREGQAAGRRVHRHRAAVHLRCTSGAGPNLIAEWPKGDAGNVYMSAPTSTASRPRPGMNDNGSGSPALLENALTLAQQNPAMRKPGPLRLVDRRGAGPQRV